MTVDASDNRAMIDRRRKAMSVLAQSASGDIADHLATMQLPPLETLRAGENGLVMLRGRVGGDGAPFNLGEAAVSRAAVRLSGGVVGVGYALGRDTEKAGMIALCDALVQSAEHSSAVQSKVIAPLSEKIAALRARQEAETAATRVDFYTLVRGEG